MTPSRVCIVGAGAAGIVSARELIRHGHEPTIFEQAPSPGGVWIYQQEPGPAATHQSAIYDSLRTNLPRDLMAYSDFPFDSAGGGDDRWPRYPHHTKVRAYLDAFVDRFDITRVLHTNTRVEEILPEGPGQWRLKTRSVEDDSTEWHNFDAIMICSGHYSAERRPALPGIEMFVGDVTHSATYRTPAPFAGKRIALWGASASGADIAIELASHGAEVSWCGDSFKARPFGESLPSGARIYPSPVRATPAGLEFKGSRTLSIDAFMYCTGYEYRFPFLGSEIVQVEDNWVHPLYLDMLAPRFPTLAFIGIPYLIVPFPLFEMQARWFARVLRGDFRRPTETEMEEAIARHHEALLGQGCRQRHFHKLGDRQTDYYNELAAQCGEAPLPRWFAELAQEAQQSRIADPIGFRDRPLATRGPTVIDTMSGPVSAD